MAGRRDAQDNTEWLVHQMCGAGVEQYLRRGIDTGDAPFPIEHDQRRRQRCQQLLRHGGVCVGQAAARERHGA